MSERVPVNPFWEGYIAGFAAAREMAEEWHANAMARLEEVNMHGGLTQYGKDQWQWHRRARDAMASLAPPQLAPDPDPGTEGEAR